jgi:hypothetical protein
VRRDGEVQQRHPALDRVQRTAAEVAEQQAPEPHRVVAPGAARAEDLARHELVVDALAELLPEPREPLRGGARGERVVRRDHALDDPRPTRPPASG